MLISNGLDVMLVKEICELISENKREVAQIACYNSSDQVLISGNNTALKVQSYLIEKGGHVISLSWKCTIS